MDAKGEVQRKMVGAIPKMQTRVEMVRNYLNLKYLLQANQKYINLPMFKKSVAFKPSINSEGCFFNLKIIIDHFFSDCS